MSEPEPEAPPEISGREIVCVGFAEWTGSLWTNQQHLMSRLALNNRVLFVESLGLRKPTLARRDLRRILKRLRAGLAGVRRVDGVDVLAPLVLPLHSNAPVQAANRGLLRLLVGRALRGRSRSKPILWGYVPQAEALIETVRPSLVVYHCVDDIAAQPGVDGESFREAERRFAARADLVIASAPALAERMRELNPKVLYAPNVADTALFSTALEAGPVDPSTAALGEPRIVFVGAVTASKLDLGLLAELARKRPRWQILLVGPVGAGDPTTNLDRIEQLENVHLLGERRREELPNVLRGCAVGLIPYRHNRLTASIFPMKVYEYMAAGLPTISTDLPALRAVDGVTIADQVDATIEAIETALAADTEGARRARSELAADHSWDRRLEQIAGAISALQR